MLSLWKKYQRTGWRAGVMAGEQETGLAIVQQRKGQLPLLKHCAVHPISEVKPEHIVTALIHGNTLARAPVSGVLNSGDYQLIQVEPPEVPAAELRAAVRWKLRDMIDFPLDEAVIDVFDIPQARRSQENKIFAVAARQVAVKRVTELLATRARGFDVIDVPELCLRNLSVLLPQDARGVALMALGDGFAQLLITRQGVLYLTRRIEFGRRFEARSRDDGSNGIDVPSLALELQRSLDYYESHFDQAPIADLILAPNDNGTRQLAQELKREMSLQVGLLEAEQLFEVANSIELDLRWPGLIALGAALRHDEASA